MLRLIKAISWPNALFLCLAVLLSFRLNIMSASPDLLASWLAGVFSRAGNFSQIYPGGDGFFTMYPPDQWRPFMQALNYDGPVYPFIYPPLWAWVASWLPEYTDYRLLRLVMTFVNPALLAAAIVLARRATAPAGGRASDALGFSLIAVAFIAGTSIGAVALLQNQPQIFVSFLLILTIERLRAGKETQAGMALALAASIKLYPLLFVPLLLAGGNYRAAGAFVIVGAVLAALSVWLMGWPLHIDFLRTLEQISGTTLVSKQSWNIDAAIAQLFFSQDLTLIPAPELIGLPGEVRGWYVLVKSATWSVLSKSALLASIALTAWMMRRAIPARRYDTIWPLALLLASLFGPLSWSYHFLPAVILLPAALLRCAPRAQIWLLLLLYVPLSWLTGDLWIHFDLPDFVLPPITVLTLCFMAAVFVRPSLLDTITARNNRN